MKRENDYDAYIQSYPYYVLNDVYNNNLAIILTKNKFHK